MKLKTIVILSLAALLLMAAAQRTYIGYALGAFRSKTEATLNACFKRAFDRTVDDKVNNLPLPEGTVTHIIHMPVRPGEIPQEEAFSFHTSQQTAAILQDVYDAPLSLDTLLMNLEKDLRSDGVEGLVTLRLFDARTDTTLQRIPARCQPPVMSTRYVSGKAYLDKDRHLAVEGQVFLPFTQGPLGRQFGFNLAAHLLGALVIAGFFFRLRSLQRQQDSMIRQRSEFYRQAKELEAPVRQARTDIASACWMPVYETGKRLLASIETVLTHAKQENARLLKSGRFFRPLLWSGMALSGIFLLTALWSFYFYMERRHEVAQQTQTAFEEAFVKESRQRRDTLSQRLSAQGRPTSLLTGTADYVAVQLDSLLKTYWVENEAMGNPQGPRIHAGYAYVKQGGLYRNENARVRRAYTNQHYFATMGEPYIPLDSLCMDSLFNACLHRANLPEGRLYFFRREADSLASCRTRVATQPVSICDDRTEWMQGVVTVDLPYVLSTDRYLFLSLLLMFLFTLFCVYIQWRIARRQRQLEQFRRDFTYAMIHDMKSPLQSVMMGAQIMAGGRIDPASEKGRRLLAAMTDECSHLLALSARVVMLRHR